MYFYKISYSLLFGDLTHLIMYIYLHYCTGKSQKWCELNYETLYAMMNRARGNVWLVDVREQAEVQKVS